MMREDKFVQVYVTIGKVDNETQYLFTVHPSPGRPKGCFKPAHIGTLTIDSENYLSLKTATEWGTNPQDTGSNAKIVSLFAYSINKCLTELLTYDIPELSFLVGKLKYGEADRVAMDWNKAPTAMRIASILKRTDEAMGIPNIPQAKYVLQIVEEPIPITNNLSLRSIMPINGRDYVIVDGEYYFTAGDANHLRRYLWWEVVLPEPISYEEFEERLEGRIKGLVYRRDGRLIYTEPIEKAEDLPSALWLYIKECYNILPDFYDEDSFETAKVLSALREL